MLSTVEWSDAYTAIKQSEIQPKCVFSDDKIPFNCKKERKSFKIKTPWEKKIKEYPLTWK